MSPVQWWSIREIEIETFITHGSSRKYPACLEEPVGEVKAECRWREREDLVLMPSLGSVGEVLWGSQARWFNSNQKSWVSVSPTGALSKGCLTQSGTGGGGGGLVITKAVREVLSGADICL